MSTVPIQHDVFDEHAERLIAQMWEEHQKKSRCDEVYFERMSDLLRGLTRVTWAERPRTYIVLRLIGRVDTMDSFVGQDLRDIHFPYTQERLPRSLSEMSDRQKFIDAQNLVLTPAKYIEDVEGGRHTHFREVVDNYFEIVKPLGRGGFGYVHHVRSRLSLNHFALKRSLRQKMFSRDKELLNTFEMELSILKKLSHEHLVKYVGSYTDPKWVGILMTPVADSDLRHFLDQKDVLQFSVLIRQFYGCLVMAVQYLHVNRIRHKDLKPQNILVKGTSILITDFGTALDWTDRSRATTTGDPGPISINYAAPEVVDREQRSESSDIWSLGCVFLEMTATLKGYTDQDRKSFFTSQFTGHSNFWANPDAFEAWLRRLERTPQDNITISWIRSMTNHSRMNRIAISSLADDIFNHQDDHVYYGPCCAGHDDGNASSYAGSPTLDRSDAADTDDLYSFPRPERHSLLGQRSNGRVTSVISSDEIQSQEPSKATAHTATTKSLDTSHRSSPLQAITSETVDPAEFWPREATSNQLSSHGGGFNPNPLPSAVAGVDRLLGRNNTGLRAEEAMPAVMSDRVDALWQHAYLMHEYDTNARRRLASVVASASVLSNPYMPPIPGQIAALEQDAHASLPVQVPAPLNDAPNVTSSTTNTNPYLSANNRHGAYTAVVGQSSEDVGLPETMYPPYPEYREQSQLQPPYKPCWDDVLDYTGVSSFRV